MLTSGAAWPKRIGAILTLFLATVGTAAAETASASAASRSRGPLAPASGVLFGAYVDPNASFGSNAEAESEVKGFESRIGRTLDIDQHYYAWGDRFPSGLEQWDLAGGRTPLISWSGTTLSSITNGSQDSLIRSRARDVKDLGKPVFIRWGWEMNGNWYSWTGSQNGGSGGAAKYVAAWRHIHRLFDAEGATNAIWVWSPNGDDVPSASWNHFTHYYPGAAYVDWVGIDGYNWGNSQSWSSWRSFSSLFSSVYRAYHARKPIMITETSSTDRGGSKAAWIANVHRAIKTSFIDVAAYVWFDVDKEQDWRVNSTRTAFGAYKTMARDPYFAGRIGGHRSVRRPLRLRSLAAAPHRLVRWSKISFSVNKRAKVWIRLRDDRGRVVRHRVRGRLYRRGAWSIRWHGRNDRYHRVHPGRYTVVVVARDRSGHTKKATIGVRVIRR